MRHKTPTGYVVYEGLSALDGATPIVGVLLTGKSRNKKTSDMSALYVLHADVPPVEAIHTGADAGICGNCPLRGRIEDGRNVGRACYVLVFQAPRQVWESYRAGTYPRASAASVAALLRGKPVRLGAYGDPAALPPDVVAACVAGARRHTGYTHQWSGVGAALRSVVMASVDSAAEASAASAAGWRYFRVAADVADVRAGEIVCPASEAAGKVTTCDRCGLCNGARPGDRRKNIVILAHGAGAAHIMRQARAREVASCASY